MTLRDGETVLSLILAGGRATRMGGIDKAFVPLAGRPLVEHVLNRASEPMAISANGDPGRFASYGAPVLADRLPGVGPLGAIEAGLRHAAMSGSAWLVTLPCDTPFLPADLASRLLAATGPVSKAAYPVSSDGAHAAAALWHIDLLPNVINALADQRLKLLDLLGEVGAQPVVFDEAEAFFNINTAEDLAKAEAMASRDHMPKA